MTNENKSIPTGLYWQGKETEIERMALPFQTIETVNESRATREKEKKVGRDMFQAMSTGNWYNRLIWGDNKYIMASLLEEFAGKIDLIYIDPPFATGADFSVRMEIGEIEWTKEPSAIEEKAYRDTWGKGLESYLQMMYERLLLMRELLSPNGSIYVHLDWRMSSYIRIIADDIFGQDSYTREIIWRMGWISGYKTMANNWIRNHDNILFYVKDPNNFTFNKKWIPYPPDYERWGGRPKGQGLAIEDIWGIFPGEGVNSLSVISFAKENLGFPTQKSEGLLDPKAVEKGDITFYELAYLEVEVPRNKNDQLIVELKDFAIPNLDLIPQDVRDKIKKWSDYIDYWAVDWDWSEDTFHNMWQSYRTRKDRKLELKSDGHRYERKGTHLVMVKVIDIFGNDTTKVIEVKA